MRLLIDGYNLLHATDLFGEGPLLGTLRGSREALLAFLAERLPAHLRRATVVVFDARDAPPGLPDRYEHEGLDLRFARGYRDADAMIEAILADLHRAKGLTVVSGDHRVQRAARASGARWVDSTKWFHELRHAANRNRQRPPSHKRVDGHGDNAEWIEAFSDPADLERIAQQAAESPPPTPRGEPRAPDPEPESPPPPRHAKRRPPLSESKDPVGGFGEGIDSIFPAGYGEDLLPRDPDSSDPDDSGVA